MSIVYADFERYSMNELSKIPCMSNLFYPPIKCFQITSNQSDVASNENENDNSSNK